MIKEWRIIDEAPNYAVSNRGEVKNLTTGRIRKLTLNRGYPSITLMNNGQMISRYVHALVASAFVGGKAPGLEVNHIDGNKQNNNAWNLEWVTRQGNIDHAVRTGLIRKLRRWIVLPDGSLEEIERGR